MSEDEITALEEQFPLLAEQAFKAAGQRTLDAGLSVLESEGSFIYEVFPNGHRRVVKQIEPPTFNKAGTRLVIG